MEEVHLEQRGYFWWADSRIPDGSFAPADAVVGTLKISVDGYIFLDLDGNLPRNKRSVRVSNGEFDESLIIAGVLRNNAKGVLIWNLSGGGFGFSEAGPSYESYRAFRCLIGIRHRKAFKEVPKITSIEFALDYYNEWFSTAAIKRTKSRKSLSLKYKQPSRKQLRLHDCSAELFFGLNIDSEGAFVPHSIHLKQTVSLTYKFEQPVDFSQVITNHAATEDFFLLLTNSEMGLKWPKLKARGQRTSIEAYYPITKRLDVPLRWSDTWIFYNEIENDLGAVLGAWREGRATHGSPYFLYASTRRGLKLYQEHRFASLVWVLESFHRSQNRTVVDRKLEERIEAILMHQPEGRDKEWLRRKLKNSHEPSLADRLREIFSSLPVGLNRAATNKFADECARLRNELSHFGGSPSGGGYKKFFAAISKMSPVLDIFYHLKLLQNVGVSNEHLLLFLSDKRRSYIVNKYLEQYGLRAEA